MKNAPSIATTDAKKTAWETGAAASAVGRCEALAPVRSHCNHVSTVHHSISIAEPRGTLGVKGVLTPTSSAGTVATTASVNASEMVLGGVLASSLKMCRISGSFPYRSGFLCVRGGAEGSCWISISKSGATRPSEDPKEAMTMLAWRGFVEVACWTGRSFWGCTQR